MSISQLLQPNPYTVYGNLSPTQSGNILNEAVILFDTPGGTPATYQDNRTFYSVTGKCVTFQSYINLDNKGDGTGDVIFQLPMVLPEAFYLNTEPAQSVDYSIVNLTDKDKYLDLIGFIALENKIQLFGVLAVDGSLVPLQNTDIEDNSIIICRGSYFSP